MTWRKPGFVTASDLARLWGLHPATVLSLYRRGRIKPDHVDESGRRWFDPVQATKDREANTEHKAAPRRGKHSKPEPLYEPPPVVLPEERDDRESPIAPSAEVFETYNEARARRERAEATKKELEVAQRKAELVEVAPVKRAWETAGLALRDALSSVGARLATALATETEPRRCKELVDDEIRRALQQCVSTIRASVPEGSP